MIDRRALWIFITAFLAMIGASTWQLCLLPDWRHMPLGGPHSHNIVSALILFTAPASLLSFMLAPFIQWLTAPKEILPSWRRWSGKWIVSWSVFWVVIQAFQLAHALDIVSVSNLDTARGGLVMIGLTFMIAGNFVAKTPSPPQGNSSLLDTWRVSRKLRFAGKLLVSLGLAFVLGGILLPLEYWNPIFLSLMLAAMTAAVWYSIKLRHERAVEIAPRPSSQANL
jgi:hypothetical protein